MDKLTKMLFLLSLTIVVLCSCRNANQAKKAIESAKKLSGQTVKASKKGTYVLRYGDDVARHIEFVSVSCATCDGNGTNNWGEDSEECEGAGVVY